MIKKQQKWIALLVTLTFIWLLNISTMPVSAAGTSEQASLTSTEQGPEYYEAIAQKAAPAKKKSILPWILIGVGVIAVTAVVLFLVVLKTNYDITGMWDFLFTNSGDSEELTVTFTGTKKSGTWLFNENPVYNGTYTVDGKKFTTTIISPDMVTQFYGEFSGKDTMTGIFVIYGVTWNWTATRHAAAASVQPTPAQAKPFFK